MILFNTTFVFEPGLEGELVSWLRKVWIARALAAGMTMPLCAKVPSPSDEACSVAVQGRFQDDEAASKWHADEGADLLGSLYRTYGDRILAFSTLMEVFEP